MRYAIINFTRLGDLLQTQSTIAALKRNKENHVSLICLESFASATAFISELDDITIFPGATILKETQTDWRQALHTLNTWADNYYKAFPFDIVLNLTPSMPCRLIAQLLSRKNKNISMQGFGIDNFGFGQNNSTWTSYVQAVTQERGCSPYNLIDGFRSMLSLPPEPFRLKIPENISQETAQIFLNEATQCICSQFPSVRADELSFVGFQLGASNKVRQWDTKNFAELGKMLWEERKIVPVLLGAHSELHIVEKYITHNQALNSKTPYINLCGKTNLEELGTILCKLNALVSNDTGTLHLAVGLGTPVLGIYLATAQVWDTGPYGENHLCLEPRLDCHPCSFSTPCPYDFKCRQHILAKTVYNALCILLDKPKSNDAEGKNKAINTDTKHTDNIEILSDDARIWQGYFDETGFINYKSLSGDEKSDRTLWMACQRIFYRNFLNAMNANGIGSIHIMEADPTQKYSTVPMPHLKNNAHIAHNTEFIQRLASLILLVKEQASMLLIRPSVKAQESFLSTIQRIESYLQQNPHFTPLLLLWKYLIQENGRSIETLVHFFDILHRELLHFSDYLHFSSK